MKRIWKTVGTLLSAGVLMLGATNQASAKTETSANLFLKIEFTVNELGEVVIDDLNLQNAINEFSGDSYPLVITQDCCGTLCNCDVKCGN